MAADGPAGEGRRGGRRVLVPLVVTAAIVAVAFRIGLGIFAADVFVAVVQRRATASGVTVEFEGDPVVSLAGFDVHGLSVHRVAGDGTKGAEWLHAESVSGRLRLLARSPYVALSLQLRGATVKPAASGSRAVVAPTTAAPVVSLPPVIASVAFEDGHLDLGSGCTLAFDASLVRNGESGLVLHATRLDYSEPSGETAAEKIAGTLSASTTSAAEETPPAHPEGGNGELRVDLSIDAGALLAGAVLFDFASHPLKVSTLVEARPGGGYRLRDLAAAFGKLLSIEGSLGLGAGGAIENADLRASSADLMPAFVALVRDPFGGVMPPLADASLDGKAALSLHLTAPSWRSADATLSASLALFGTRDLVAEHLTLDLPWIGSAISGVSSRRGHVGAANLRFLGLSWSGVDAPLEATRGRLRATSPQQWKAAGGTLAISDLVFDDDAHDGPLLAANVTLDGFDLAEIGAALGLPGLAGSLHGDLGRVEITADAIRAAGGLDVGIFGGSLALSRMFVDDPFGRVPSVGLDAKLSEIDLGRTTDFLGVGRVNGVLEGGISNLVLVAGQPQSFDADLHTVERNGVPQNVDVRAIVQLGVLGGGDDGSVTSSLLKIVHRYRYSAIGIRCRLRNDVFELRGLPSAGGRDYLVKGSLLPPSVSVVSHSQVVSFSEMLRRIERITAIEEGGSPRDNPE